jgi:hypothetical protein
MGPPEHLSPTFLITCVKCRYRLRGLPADGVCPECGTPIAQRIEWWQALAARKPWWVKLRELAGPPLRDADVRWLRRVLAGTLTLAATWLFVAAWAVARRVVSPQSYAPDYMLAAVGAWYLASAWLLTSSERRPDVPARWEAVRWGIRMTSAGACLATWLALRAERVPAGDFWRYSSLAITLGVLCIPAAATMTFLVLAHLAARIPRPWAAGALRVLGWGIIAVMLALCCLGDSGLLHLLYPSQYDRGFDTLGGHVDGVVRACDGIGYALYALVLLILLRLARDLGRCAVTARR